MTPLPASRLTLGRSFAYDGTLGQARAIAVPEEVPVNVVYGNVPYAVMMMTPADIEDFVVGFSLTEGVVEAAGEIRAVAVREEEGGLIAAVDLAGPAMQRHLARRRSLSGRTGCGLCGVESLDQLPAATRRVSGAPASPEAIGRALGELTQHQPLNRLTRAVHAAAWCDAEGAILAAREDVGRHNALDKAIGACLRAGHAAAGGFMVITSRCSFEMLEKTATFGAATLVAISAPTSLAIARAHALGIALVAVARDDAALAFPQPPVQPPKALAS